MLAHILCRLGITAHLAESKAKAEEKRRRQVFVDIRMYIQTALLDQDPTTIEAVLGMYEEVFNEEFGDLIKFRKLQEKRVREHRAKKRTSRKPRK